MNASNAQTEVAYISLEEDKSAFFAHALAEGYTLVVLHTRRVENR